MSTIAFLQNQLDFHQHAHRELYEEVVQLRNLLQRSGHRLSTPPLLTLHDSRPAPVAKRSADVTAKPPSTAQTKVKDEPEQEATQKGDDVSASRAEACGGGDVKKVDVGAEGRASEVNDKVNGEKREAGGKGEDEDGVKMETDMQDDDATEKATVENSDAEEKIDPVS